MEGRFFLGVGSGELGPEVSSFQSRAVTTDLSYLRFHHGTRGRRGNYSPTELYEWRAGSAACCLTPQSGRTSATTGRGSHRRRRPLYASD
jgi:hypothetical protein